MARALMADPDMIMLDEPMAGVNPVLVRVAARPHQGLPEVGVTVMFVEHDMDVVMGISDWVVCMGVGSVIAEGTPGRDRREPRGDRRLPRLHPRRSGVPAEEREDG